MKTQIVKGFATTTANLYNSQIDLYEPGVTVYRDKGYLSATICGSMDKTMKKATRNHPQSTKDKRRNIAIPSFRSLGEKTYSVIKRLFHIGHVMVTTVEKSSCKKSGFMFFFQSLLYNWNSPAVIE